MVIKFIPMFTFRGQGRERMTRETLQRPSMVFFREEDQHAASPRRKGVFNRISHLAWADLVPENYNQDGLASM